MSPLAARQLRAFRFAQVHGYMLGIAGWRVAGLAVEDDGPTGVTVATATRDDQIGAARVSTVESGSERAIVTPDDGVIVGCLQDATWDHGSGVKVGLVMELGQTTVRPNETPAPLVDRKQKRGTNVATVTTAQGALLGIVIREQSERSCEGSPQDMLWAGCDGYQGQCRRAKPN